MKTLISILFILTFYTLKGNNNQTITGHVTDYKKNDLIAVTVRCFVDDWLLLHSRCDVHICYRDC